MENENYKFKGDGLDKNEKVSGKKMFEDYCNHYHIESYSDMQLLEELIYREVMQKRLKKKIEQLEEKYTKENKEYSVPRHVMETMNENFEQVVSIKEKLGMLENKEGQDGFNYIQRLKAKFKKWKEENQGSRSFPCPHCSKMIMLSIRTEAWESQKHPFFKDKILANKKLWQLYKEGKITKQDVADVLGCSAKHVEWLEKVIYMKPSQD
jgi:hypothetical protein